MRDAAMESLKSQLSTIRPMRQIGRISRAEAGMLHVSGLGRTAFLGDRLELRMRHGTLGGEVLKISSDEVLMLPDAVPDGVRVGDAVTLLGPVDLAPDDSWIGRVVDPYGVPLDGRTLTRGATARPIRRDPPPPGARAALGGRLETGMSVFNTFLPIVDGQRIGLFAGSGVGKSSLLGHFAKRLESDVTVVALVGERGRELREFIEETLGAEGLSRSIIVAATSDQSPLSRRRCAWAAMAVAEHFRDQGRRVVFLADSITRFAEAHREIAVAAGEIPALRGYPPSTAHMIMQLCERAGPGPVGAGTITAVFSVLVAGSDVEEPIADILRGVLDGHVVLDRAIAERGRYPAVDLLRSVSRSLPKAATEVENAILAEARALLAAYERSEMMIRAGLYTAGSDPQLDQAIQAFPELDAFIGAADDHGIDAAFNRLGQIVRRAARPRGPAQRRMPPRDGGAPKPPGLPKRLG